MIQQALQHCAGIGPVRLAKLKKSGVRSWTDVLDFPDRIPRAWRDELTKESHRCLTAIDTGDIRYFVDCFAPKDKWRILHHFLDQTTFFDIETEGLEYDAPITVIVCWHRGQLHTFVEHENLDDFLTVLDDVSLLASFNGSTFDVPRVLDSFHIPALPCPHLDLRWPCYHQGFKGGLKDITQRMGISRPPDLQDADGELAVRLWQAWMGRNVAAAREQLIRYCSADVLLLVMLAHRLIGSADTAEGLWSRLPESQPTADPVAVSSHAPRNRFGPASPAQVRAWRRRYAG